MTISVTESEFVPICKSVIPGKPMVPACTCPSEPLVVKGVAYDRISPSCLIHGRLQAIPLREEIYDSANDLIDFSVEARPRLRSIIAKSVIRHKRKLA